MMKFTHENKPTVTLNSKQAKALKKCPWCGSGAYIEHWHGGGPDKHAISCSNGECFVTPMVVGESLAIALNRWNKRKKTEALQVFTTTEASFGFHVGTAVVVVATDRREAKKLVEGLGGTFDKGTSVLEALPVMNTGSAGALVLQDGDY